MPFGLSFGSRTNRTNSTTDVDRTESTNQNQSSNRSSTGISTSNSLSNATGSTTGTQSSATSGTNQTTGTTAGTTRQTTSAFSDPILQGIERVATQMFGQVGGRPTLSNFDAESFVEQGSAAANSEIQAGLESTLNQLTTNTGGAAGNNSMTSILGNRLRNDAAAQRAGVRANLTSQAEGIKRDNSLASNTIAATDQGFLGQILSVLKGGTVTTTGEETQQMSQNQQTQQINDTRTAEQTSQQTQQQQQQTQALLESLQQILSGTTNTTGTESTQATNRSSGGGFSLGL